jgi:hypothetical protein
MLGMMLGSISDLSFVFGTVIPEDAALPKPAEGSDEDVYEVEASLDHDFKYNVLYSMVH